MNRHARNRRLNAQLAAETAAHYDALDRAGKLDLLIADPEPTPGRYALADRAAEVIRKPKSRDNAFARAARAEKAAKLFAIIASEFVIDADSVDMLATFFSECGTEVWESVSQRAGTRAPSAETISHCVNLIRAAAGGAS